jgi:Fis family transcriptional regulator, factor for inversion stimulation protein
MNTIDSAIIAEYNRGMMTSLNLPLQQSIKKSLENYCLDLDGITPTNLYKLVMSQVEPALLEFAMALAKNNQSEAARILKLSRGTLRKKLKQYKLHQ